MILAALLLLLSYKVSDPGIPQKELSEASDKISNRITSVLSEIESRYSEEYFFNTFAQKKITKEEVLRLNNLPYVLLAYRGDSLAFWSNNEVIPAQPGSYFPTVPGFHKFKNGYYLTWKNSFLSKAGKPITLLALIPVKYDYVTSNSYLRNHFSSIVDLPPYFSVSPDSLSGFVPVRGNAGGSLFYIGMEGGSRTEQAGALALIFFISGLIVVMMFINYLLDNLHERRRIWLRPLILFFTLIAVAIYLSNKSWLPDDVENWRVFNPDLYASRGVASSLGGLFIQLVFLVWICVHLTNKFNVRLRFSTSSIGGYLTHLAGYAFIFLFGMYGVGIIQSLVRDSKIEFAFLNPLEPDYFSILAVLSIALLLACFFLLSEKIISILRQKPLRWFDNILVLLSAMMLSMIYYVVSDIGISGIWIMVWIAGFILALPYFRLGKIERLNFARLFLLLVFFACSGAALLFYFGDQKEKDTRLEFAKKLISDRDAVTEYLLTELKPRIEADPFVIQFFQSPHLSGKELGERLQQLYFQEGFNRYSVRFYPFDRNGFLLHGSGEDFGYVTEKGIKSGKISISENLFYSISPAGSITYLSVFDVSASDSLKGKLYVELNADAYQSAGVYPELLLSEKDKPPAITPEYSYAVYSGQKLILQHGLYHYEFKFPWTLKAGEEIFHFRDKKMDHLIYSPQNNISIVVSKNSNSPSYFLSYFSFLFVVMFALTAGIVLFNVVFYHPGIHSLSEVFKFASLRTLIHAFFMIFILIILFVTGYVTGNFFLKQFNDLSQIEVSDKMKRVADAVNYMVAEYKVDTANEHELSALLRSRISQLADIQDNEINFYDRTGDLIASSQPSIFEKGIISRKINTIALYELKREFQTALINEEHIGRLKFYSGYQAIRGDRGQLLVFINLPYYNSRQHLNMQVGFFFVTLVNILVIAIIIAGLMAPFISRQITSKLAVIGEKFKKVKVGSANELIEWHADDEIGNLVNEYNKMIIELEESANKLARSEREFAWREMAKQVAHEIKNPLTPMKLSIQHLKRAYDQNAPNLKEMVAKVSNVLIEQIDTLSRIATEFSDYAKMPNPKIEKVNVNEILKSAGELHEEFEHVDILLHNNAEHDEVEADKNQLLIVFNNLILNAVQAIPEDRQGHINIISENDDGQVIISVSDNGVGISGEESHRVFVPNFTTKSSGTGLGLALCKNIVESFGGSISFTSHKNIGTTFYVRLPLSSILV